MLGKIIKDPGSLESLEKEAEGLGLFDFETTLNSEKITRQIQLMTAKSNVFPEGIKCHGYEIHMGLTAYRSTYTSLFSTSNRENSMNFGIIHQAGTVFGTYLHGFIDNAKLRNNILKYIRSKRGVPEL